MLWILLGLLVVFVILCAVFRDLLYAAISLALASVMLAMILFRYHANVAAVFELSVCAGLITVLFVSTASLTKDSDKKTESRLAVWFLPFILLLFVGVDLFLVRWLATAISSRGLGSLRGEPFQTVFWGMRTSDILGQISLILVGVFGILAIFRAVSAGGKHE